MTVGELKEALADVDERLEVEIAGFDIQKHMFRRGVSGFRSKRWGVRSAGVAWFGQERESFLIRPTREPSGDSDTDARDSDTDARDSDTE